MKRQHVDEILTVLWLIAANVTSDALVGIIAAIGGIFYATRALFARGDNDN